MNARVFRFVLLNCLAKVIAIATGLELVGDVGGVGGAEGDARCVTLLVGGAGGAGGNAICASLYAGCAGRDALYAGDCGGWIPFDGGAGGSALCATLYAGDAGGAGHDALCATLYAGRARRDALCATLLDRGVGGGGGVGGDALSTTAASK